MSGRKSPERADKMIALRAEGETLEAIATRFGITRQRVHQIIKQRERELRLGK